MNQQNNSIIFDEKDESFLDLANHILKKNSLAIESLTKFEGESSNCIECFLHSISFIASKVSQNLINYKKKIKRYFSFLDN